VQDKQANNPPSESSIKTYADLEVAYTAHLRSENKSEQDIKNFRSNLNTWRQSFNAELDTAINLHFGEKFSVNLEKFKAKQRKDKAKGSTIASKSSKLKKINEFLTTKASRENLSLNFAERLRQLIRKAGFATDNQFWSMYLKGKCGRDTFRAWCQGERYPGYDSQKLLNEIEKSLEVPTGTLSSLIRSTFNQKKVVRRQTANVIRLRALNRQNYHIWTLKLEKEFQGLMKFKTESVLPSGVKRHKRAKWTISEGGELGTAVFTKTFLQSFFGYLCLPKNAPDPMFRGLGYSKKNLTIGLLADKNLVEGFITGFRKIRSFNTYNNGHLKFLALCTSLLRPETGYIYQIPDFALKIGLSDDVKKWQNQCEDTRNRLVEIHTAIDQERVSKGPEFKMGRDPKEAIEDILALPNPLAFIIELLGIMLKDLDTYPAGTLYKAVFFRDILLMALLVANPLRIRMYSIMKFDRNLIRKSDGSWWIFFKREDFKNRKSLPSDYEVLVAPELIPLIERYKKEFRLGLFGAEESDYVFLKEANPTIKKHTGKKPKTLIYKEPPAVKDLYKFSPIVLSARIAIRVRNYLPESPGFRAHAFRHIAATSVIKTNPEMGFFLASKVLHDKLETVERDYVHLKTHEFFEPYNRFLSGFLGKIIDSDGSRKPSPGNGGGGK
jgi:integrase